MCPSVQVYHYIIITTVSCILSQFSMSLQDDLVKKKLYSHDIGKLLNFRNKKNIESK